MSGRTMHRNTSNGTESEAAQSTRTHMSLLGLPPSPRATGSRGAWLCHALTRRPSRRLRRRSFLHALSWESFIQLLGVKLRTEFCHRTIPFLASFKRFARPEFYLRVIYPFNRSPLQGIFFGC